MIANAYASATDNIPPQALYDNPGFWVAVAFVIFVLIFARPVWKFSVKSLDKKINAIETSIEEATKLREEAQDLLASYKRKLATAEKEAEDIIGQAREEALTIKAKMTKDLKSSLSRREKLALDRISQAENDATSEVRTMITDVALLATRQLLIENIDNKKADELINKSIVDLSNKLN